MKELKGQISRSALKPDPFKIQPIVTQKTKKTHKVDWWGCPLTSSSPPRPHYV